MAIGAMAMKKRAVIGINGMVEERVEYYKREVKGTREGQANSPPVKRATIKGQCGEWRELFAC